ncbi:MAG: LysE family transporter [Alistipes sp.]|nr:threonine transporter RhtB [Rikenellaceae bacterium]MBO5188752.1 LysE family transporter [Alistipes sp.]MBQ2728577.1 LysE family transporter [Alistipes sp.]MBQ3082538.1 LysE family transporter [Alistipes sp.]MBQ7297940.1 LysE family transporter [Alistipes sp.]
MTVSLIEVLFRGLMVGVAASITVGPVAVLCIQRTLSKSRRSGIISGVGVACADTFMAIVALLFYSMLEHHIHQYDTLLRVIGGIFVVMVGVYVFTQNPVPQIRRNRAGRTSLWQDFASIFGLTIANFIMVIPYILAFFAVFEISSNDITGSGFAGFLRAVLTIGGFFGGAVAWWTFVAFVINLFRRRFRPRHMLTINRVAGLIIGVLGIYTILSTFFDIFPNVGY